MKEESKLSKEERFSAYVKTFVTLKEQNTLKEIMQQELLLEFIKTNMDRIDEFPLLETEQKSIINLLCKRALDHPVHEYMRDWLDSFIISLNKYNIATANKDEEGVAEQMTTLSNLEALLVQCIQGAVYNSGLIKDNYSFTLVNYFSALALDRIKEMNEQVEFDEHYWLNCLEGYIMPRLNEVYEELIDQKKYQVVKDDKLLLIKFPFDSIKCLLHCADVKIEKTRIQTAFEARGVDPEYQAVKKFFTEYLSGKEQPLIAKHVNPRDIAHVAQIVSIDTICKDFMESRQAKPEPPQEQPQSKEDREKLKEEQANLERQNEFIKQQAVAMAVGAAIADSLSRDDFAKAVQRLLPQGEVNIILDMLANFEIPEFDRGMFFLLMFLFSSILKEKAGEDASRIIIKRMQTRRTPRKALVALQEVGLNRIRQKKFWDDDHSNEDYVLFKAKTATDLLKLIKMFHIESPLREKIAELWESADMKIDLLVVINLAQMAKVTTNLSARIVEIMKGYGITSLS